MGKDTRKGEVMSVIKYAKAARMNPGLNGVIEEILRKGTYETQEDFETLYDVYMEKRAWN